MYLGDDTEGNGICMICLLEYNSIDYWTLGVPFMRDWYIVHDYETDKIGFTRLPGSDLPMPEIVNPETIYAPGYLSVVWGLAFSFGVFYYVWKNRPPPPTSQAR